MIEIHCLVNFDYKLLFVISYFE